MNGLTPIDSLALDSIASSSSSSLPTPTVSNPYPSPTLASSSRLNAIRDRYPSPTKHGLRSCLSPSRSVSGAATPERPPSSRTTSFSSEASYEGGWRRTKSVRWEGEDQGEEGCAVTSYHATWSATEYDRSPLEPPSKEERDCVLPERGSRCLRPTIDCFNTQIILDETICESPADHDISSTTIQQTLILPPPIIQDELPFAPADDDEGEHNDNNDNELNDNNDDAESREEEEEEEDREWEETMERRRMMFAMRSKDLQLENRQPEFEGYRSITATLVDLLRSVGCEDDPEEQPKDATMEKSEEGAEVHLLSEQNLGEVFDVEPTMATPSLLSSNGSEAESIFASSPVRESQAIMLFSTPMPITESPVKMAGSRGSSVRGDDEDVVRVTPAL